MRLAAPLEKLVEEFARLPGVGPKSAQRLALHMMSLPREQALALSHAITEARDRVAPCSECGYYTDRDPCRICQDHSRDESLLCLVEEAKDVLSVEKTGYRGKYLVLNFGPRSSGMDLRRMDVDRLFVLLDSRKVREIIVATNPTIDGEVVARYVAETTRDRGIKVTKLAYGLPVGGDIEFIDEITLRRAFDGRSEL
ncbi:MAG: recombination mediator RecR [Solirubrobacterales bacterium]